MQNTPSKTLEVLHRGQVYKTAYFVESGMVHAAIGANTTMAPASAQSPEEVVRTLVVGKLEQRDRRLRLRAQWQQWQDRGWARRGG